jgi:hypothetical protein
MSAAILKLLASKALARIVIGYCAASAAALLIREV